MDDKDRILEVKIGERSYRLHCDVQSPLDELLGVLCEFQYFVMSRMKEVQPIQDDQPSVVPDEILSTEE